jgi:flagellin
MRINNNLMAMNTHRQLGINSGNGAKAIEKLSSGYRINRAGDDAAGLAISEKMRGQIRGLNQASRNSQDAISLVQTAEGALNETQAILQRMRELSVQSANDTNVSSDRTAIQNEIDQLSTEIDRIGNTTEFNTRKLLNGGATVGSNVSGAAASQVKVTGASADTQVGTLAITGFVEATADQAVGAGAGLKLTDTLTAASTITINNVSFNFAATDTVQDVLDQINGASIGVTATHPGGTGAGDITLTSDVKGSQSTMTIANQTGSFAGSQDLELSSTLTTNGADATAAITGTPSYSSIGNTITIESGSQKGLEFTVEGSTGAANIAVTANGGLSMQIGANQNQDMYVAIGDMRAAALGVNAVDISTAANAKSAITTVNDAITKVSTERAKLGAVQNRLEHTIKNLDTSSENLQASESRIRDVDMAKEMMNFTKNNILQQAAQSMLAQANQAPQGVLQLLR